MPAPRELLSLRPAQESDIEALTALAAAARRFMAEQGNAGQWHDGYPGPNEFARDIAAGASWVCVGAAGEIVGTMAVYDYEPSYEVIRDGAWLNEAPYLVLHRVACSPGQGVGTFMLKSMQLVSPNLRVDTMDVNRPMRGLLTKLGFAYCGRIVIAGRGERVAYQWTRPLRCIK